MNPNWLFIPTLLLATVVFIIGIYFGEYQLHHPKNVFNFLVLIVVSIIIAIPGILFTVYYLHFFDNASWFYQFRSLPWTELSASGLGLLGGVLYKLARHHHLVSRTFMPVILVMLLMWLMIPYVKPLFYSVDFKHFEDRWFQGICLQTIPSSCGPASAATLLRAVGYLVSERQLAQECFTSIGGTENWYIARALKRRGLEVKYLITTAQPSQLYYPAIAGVRLNNGVGHFVTILGETESSYLIGDPLVGKRLLNKNHFNNYYYFTGFFMLVK